MLDKTSALHAEIGRLCEITNRLDAGAEGIRPSLPTELQQAERWLGEISAAAATAEERLSIAEQDYIAAANGAREAMRRRDDAVWAATVEAAAPALRKLGRAVSAVYERDARVRSLISALREVGNRNSETNSGAFAAASAVETALNAIRSDSSRHRHRPWSFADRAAALGSPCFALGAPDWPPMEKRRKFCCKSRCKSSKTGRHHGREVPSPVNSL